MKDEERSETRVRRVAWVALILTGLLPIVLHLHFILLDRRMPRDLGNFYRNVPDFWRLIHGQQARFGPEGMPQPWDSGVWYEWVLAFWLRITGPSGEAFRAWDLLWQIAILVFVGLAAHGLNRQQAAADPATRPHNQPLLAAAFAVALAGSMRSLVIMPRLSWIHVVEAGLVVGAAVPWLRDPTLRRGFLPTALLGALALLLRSSGLPWILPLALGLAVGVQGQRPDWRRLLFVGLAWLLAALPSLLSLASYLGPKVASRARYAQNVAPFSQQILELAGPVAPIAALLGVVLAGRRLVGLPQALLMVWILIPIVLWAIFRAGMDNFLVGFAALVILAAHGLARRPLLGAALVLPGWLLLNLPQLVPQVERISLVATALAWSHLSLKPALRDIYVPFTEWGHPHLQALLDATCPANGSCVLAVDQGLLVPYSEDAGNLEAFLLDRSHPPNVFDIRGRTASEGLTRAHALIHYDCGWQDGPWRNRFPSSWQRLQSMISMQQMRTAWMAPLGQECVVHWLTPDGAVLRDDLLPSNWATPSGAVPTYEPPRGTGQERPVRVGG